MSNENEKDNGESVATRTTRISNMTKQTGEMSSDLSALNKLINPLKDLAVSPAVNASMNATLSLTKDLNSQAAKLKDMFSMQDPFVDMLRPLSEKLREPNRFSSRVPNFEIPDLENIPTSALQVRDFAKISHQTHEAMANEKALQRKGIEAQIESAEILGYQRDDMKGMREAMNALLKHSFEQAEQTAIALRERDKVETRRFRLTTFITLLAATGVITFINTNISLAEISGALYAIYFWFGTLVKIGFH
jgi:hypothetical protein